MLNNHACKVVKPMPVCVPGANFSRVATNLALTWVRSAKVEKQNPEDNLRHKFKPKCRGTRLSPSHPTNRTATMTKRSFDFHLMSKVVCLKHARHVAPSFICSAPTSIRLRSSYRHDGPRWSPDLKAQHSGTEWPISSRECDELRPRNAQLPLLH